jgi:hypothetical protein
MESPARLLLVRHFRRPTGGNIKLRDYFLHAAAHPAIEADIWFASGGEAAEGDIWSEVDPRHQVRDPSIADYRLVCVNGKDWPLLPADTGSTEVIHFVQHAGYLDDPVLRGYLARPAHRVCTTRALRDAIAPVANGSVTFLPIGVADGFFARAHRPRDVKVAIVGTKQPAFAVELAERLRALGLAPVVVGESWMAHGDMAALFRSTEVLVTLPLPTEGFFLPALEGMAAGCVVVTNDAVGNRGHCVPGETCLQPARGDVDAHVAAVVEALGNADLRRRLVEGGRLAAAPHSMAAERAAFHAFLNGVLGR